MTVSDELKAEQRADEMTEMVVAMLRNTLAPYESLLLAQTATTLLNEVAGILGNRLEGSLVKLKYTQQGVLQLDKVVRSICNELINNGGSEIRTCFSRVNRLIAILSCDDVVDVAACDS